MYRFCRFANQIGKTVNQFDKVCYFGIQRSFSQSCGLRGDYLSGSVAGKGTRLDKLYTKEHEWIKMKNENVGIIGLTDYAVNALGDIVYVELPEIGQELEKGETCGVVESVKAAGDIYCPVTGTIEAVNSDLAERPEIINVDPNDEGWIFELKLDNLEELDELMSKENYDAYLKEAD